MDRLQSMRVFREVIDEGSFAGASRSLNMSPAAVTRWIADLEEHLGTRLLQRSTRRLALTEAGEIYLGKVRQILQDVEEADAVASSATTDLSGLLRVQAPPVLASYHLAPIIRSFREQYPQISIDIDVWSPKDPPIEDYDLTLLSADDVYDANVIARKILESKAILVATPQYLKLRGTPTEPKQLAEHDCLRIKSLGARPHTWKLWCEQDPSRPLEIDAGAALWANHTATLIEAALDHAGIASIPIDLAAPYLSNRSLVRVLSPWITGHLTMYAAVPSRKFVPRRTQVFFDFLVQRLRARVATVLNACEGCGDDKLIFVESTGTLKWPNISI